jgi:hypothetical protein
MPESDTAYPAGLPVVVSCACFGLCRGEITALDGDVFSLTSQLNMVGLGDRVSLTVTLDGSETFLSLEGVVCGQSPGGFEVRLAEWARDSRDRLHQALRAVGTRPGVGAAGGAAGRP